MKLFNRIGFVFALMVMTVVSTVSLSAQTSDPESVPVGVCTQSQMGTIHEEIAALNNLLLDVQANEQISVMTQIRATIDSAQYLCSARFTQETHPNGIVGPLFFDGEIYQVTLTTWLDAYDIGGMVSGTRLDGSCSSFLISTDGNGIPETNLVSRNANCLAMFEVIVADRWELTFTKIQ